MKTLVVYKSKTGFTKRYAQWISQELSCPAMDYKDLSKNSLNDIDLLIYGSRIHAGNFNGIKKIKKLAEENKCKLVVFATGASPAELNEQIDQIWENNKIDSSIPHFYMQSGLCYEKMGPVDKLMMKIFVRALKSKKEKTQTDSDMINAVSKSYDLSSKDSIKPLVEYVKKMNI